MMITTIIIPITATTTIGVMMIRTVTGNKVDVRGMTMTTICSLPPKDMCRGRCRGALVWTTPSIIVTAISISRRWSMTARLLRIWACRVISGRRRTGNSRHRHHIISTQRKSHIWTSTSRATFIASPCARVWFRSGLTNRIISTYRSNRPCYPTSNMTNAPRNPMAWSGIK